MAVCWKRKSTRARAIIRAVRLVTLATTLSIALSGCPVPIPTCEGWQTTAPGVGAVSLMPVHQEVPDESALVFGRIEVRGLKQDGVLSLRLVNLKSSLISGRVPYGEQEIWLESDGRFQWTLPEGEYAIQPIRYNYAYVRQSYTKYVTINISLRFSAYRLAESEA